jgi:hypothetical protein
VKQDDDREKRGCCQTANHVHPAAAQNIRKITGEYLAQNHRHVSANQISGHRSEVEFEFVDDVGRQPVVYAVIAKLQETGSERPQGKDLAALGAGKDFPPLVVAPLSRLRHCLVPTWRLRHHSANENSKEDRN